MISTPSGEIASNPSGLQLLTMIQELAQAEAAMQTPALPTIEEAVRDALATIRYDKTNRPPLSNFVYSQIGFSAVNAYIDGERSRASIQEASRRSINLRYRLNSFLSERRGQEIEVWALNDPTESQAIFFHYDGTDKDFVGDCLSSARGVIGFDSGIHLPKTLAFRGERVKHSLHSRAVWVHPLAKGTLEPQVDFRIED